MKRLLISVIALFLVFSVQASAQVKFGVTAGMNFNTAKLSDFDVNSKAGWNAGVTCLLDLPLGFSVQPSLVYNQKGAFLADGISQSMGYLELPVSIQWGPDLIALRPFLDVTPYVGYGLSNKLKGDFELAGIEAGFESKDWDGKQRFEYGLGLGAGVNVWKLQVIARYCWNLGKLYNGDAIEDWDNIKDHLNKDELSTESKNFGGINICVAFFF